MYFHYTSRHLAQEIIITGELISRTPNGRIYLREDAFPSGAEAARRLSIIGKPVEVVCIIPVERVKDMLETPEPRHVPPLLGPEGEEIRPGCGWEYFTNPGVRINVKGVNWYNLPSP